MEHDFLINGSYTAAALQILLGLSIMAQGMVRKYSLVSRFVKYMVPYLYSFSPVVLLVYFLYAVSNNLR